MKAAVAFLVVVSMVAVASLGVIVYDSLSALPDPPNFSLRRMDDGLYQVVAAEKGLSWHDLVVHGCQEVPQGPVEAGQRMEGCGENATVAWHGLVIWAAS